MRVVHKTCIRVKERNLPPDSFNFFEIFAYGISTSQTVIAITGIIAAAAFAILSISKIGEKLLPKPKESRVSDFLPFDRLMEVTDLVLLDIKHIDDQAHQQLTGWTNQNILELARYLDEIHKPVWIRHVLVPGRTDEDRYLIELDAFISSLNNVERLEVLPYHTLGAYKWKELGIPYPLENIDPPTVERIQNANKLLHTNSYMKHQN